MSDYDEAASADTEQAVQRQNFDVRGPVEIDLSIITGQVTINLVEEPGATVEVRHDPRAEGGWFQNLGGWLNWLGEQFGEEATGEGPADAVRDTKIELVEGRLTVHGPRGRLRMVPLAVTVRAPAGSNLNLRSGSAHIAVTGPAGRVNVSSGSAEIALDRADGPADIKAGSGALRLGPMLGGLRARSGSGEIEVSSVGGPTVLVTGSGDVWLGAVQADVKARTGSGDLTVADAACGDVELVTGSGDIRVGVRPGRTARVELVSGSGQARSDLKLSDQPPSGDSALKVRGRTGSGAAVVTAAVG
ncbi:MAG TPA: DUF4097 family beta strand repeat-containing protein [Pseudonocardiaceae bacterium]|jgi:hypothetical protein|nr:DUF4097 family beta strand repeat-containing protein [Pseudonocardiaceae bacterium]